MNEEERGNRSAVAGQQTEVVVLAGGCFWGGREDPAGTPRRCGCTRQVIALGCRDAPSSCREAPNQFRG
jgi:hypothetical protein